MDNSQAKYIDIEGINTRYFEEGSGEPMILIHGGQMGMASSAEIWFMNFSEFAKNYHVYAFDKLGQGYTDNPKINEDYTMSAQVKHAVAFMNKLNITNAHLLGHSRGGYMTTRELIHFKRSYGLDEIALVPSSYTLDPDIVDISTKIGSLKLKILLVQNI